MTAHPVRHADLQRSHSFDELVSRGEPVVLANLLVGSPLGTWDLAHFASRAGARNVSMVRRLRGDASDASRRSVTMLPAQAYADGVASHPADYTGTSVRCVLDEVFPEFAAELAPRPFVDPRQYLRAELFSGLDYSIHGHCHPKVHALLCHLEGKKDVVLYPPGDTPLLYPHPVYAEEYATSRADFFSLDPTLFPRLAKGHRLVLRLAAGDALFIPVGYWHAVSAPGISSSVSFFWRARARDQGSLRATVRNQVGWTISQAVERMAPSISRLPGFVRTVVRRHHPTAVASARGDRAAL
jgi:hypothetical protein